MAPMHAGEDACVLNLLRDPGPAIHAARDQQRIHTYVQVAQLLRH
ncbi:hypothetical protein ACL02S_09950 [Nocardia sp. 004]